MIINIKYKYKYKYKIEAENFTVICLKCKPIYCALFYSIFN